jgi:site-specific recombinase XerC
VVSTAEALAPSLEVVPEESFDDLFAAWIANMIYRELSPNTVKLYSRVVEVAHADLGDLRDLPSETLNAWVQSKGGKAGTAGNRICALTSFYKFLVKSKRLAVNPALDLDRPRQFKGVPKPIEDLEAMYEACDHADVEANEKGAIPRPVGQTRAMATFLCNSGLRIHEAVALHVPCPVGRSITIIGKGRKEAIVPLNAKAREALDFLGGMWPIGARATQRRFEKVGIHPHKCRHTFATNLIKAGEEIGTVSKLCRHSSPATTMIYAAYNQSKLEEAVDRI